MVAPSQSVAQQPAAMTDRQKQALQVQDSIRKNINYPNSEIHGFPVLASAIFTSQGGCDPVIKILLDKGAEPKVKFKQVTGSGQKNLFELAFHYGKRDALNMLYYAAKKTYPEGFEEFAKNFRVNLSEIVANPVCK